MIDEWLDGAWPASAQNAAAQFRQGDLVESPPSSTSAQQLMEFGDQRENSEMQTSRTSYLNWRRKIARLSE